MMVLMLKFLGLAGVVLGGLIYINDDNLFIYEDAAVELVYPKKSTFSTLPLIWGHYKVVH